MAQTQPVKNKPWFAVGNKLGDRTLAQQMQGLDRLFAEVKKHGAGSGSVLDIGCAEGLISIELARAGFACVTGIEIRPDAVARARELKARDRDAYLVHNSTWLQFHVGDANTYVPDADGFQIVIMLAVLHKLKNPTAACARFAAAARDLVVIRLPPEHAPTIVDERSGMEPHHVGLTMERSGFVLEHAAYDGPFGEWVGYYRRVRA